MVKRRVFISMLLAVCYITVSMSQNVKWKMKPIAERLIQCSENIWKKQYGNKWVLIDVSRNNTPLAADNSNVPLAVDSITPFCNGYALALDLTGAQWRIRAIIDNANGLVIKIKDSKFFYATDVSLFSERLVPYAKNNGKEGFLDITGKEIVKAKYNKVYPFFERHAYVIDKKGIGKYINSADKVVTAEQREETDVVRLLSLSDQIEENKDFNIYKEGELYGYKHGEEVFVHAQFTEAMPFYGDYARVRKGDDYGILMLTNSTIESWAAKKDGKPYYFVKPGAGYYPAFLKAYIKKNANAAPEEMEVDMDFVSNDTVAYAISGNDYDNGFEALLYYDDILMSVMKHDKKVEAAATPQRHAAVASGGLVINSVYKKGKKADKNDNEYIMAKITNTSKSKMAGTVTIYVDGKAYPTKVSLGGGRSQVVSATVKVKKERFASVYVRISNGQRSAVKKMNLKPFY